MSIDMRVGTGSRLIEVTELSVGQWSVRAKRTHANDNHTINCTVAARSDVPSRSLLPLQLRLQLSLDHLDELQHLQ